MPTFKDVVELLNDRTYLVHHPFFASPPTEVKCSNQNEDRDKLKLCHQPILPQAVLRTTADPKELKTPNSETAPCVPSATHSIAVKCSSLSGCGEERASLQKMDLLPLYGTFA